VYLKLNRHGVIGEGRGKQLLIFGVIVDPRKQLLHDVVPNHPTAFQALHEGGAFIVVIATPHADGRIWGKAKRPRIAPVLAGAGFYRRWP
jgi:hypothetical protein